MKHIISESSQRRAGQKSKRQREARIAQMRGKVSERTAKEWARYLAVGESTVRMYASALGEQFKPPEPSSVPRQTREYDCSVMLRESTKGISSVRHVLCPDGRGWVPEYLVDA